MNFAFIVPVYFLYPETANRTLEDLDDYFDKDSGHKTIIPIGDKIAKQHQRPQEAIDAERRRIELATESGAVKRKMSETHYVENATELWYIKDVVGEWAVAHGVVDSQLLSSGMQKQTLIL